MGRRQLNQYSACLAPEPNPQHPCQKAKHPKQRRLAQWHTYYNLSQREAETGTSQALWTSRPPYLVNFRQVGDPVSKNKVNGAGGD